MNVHIYIYIFIITCRRFFSSIFKLLDRVFDRTLKSESNTSWIIDVIFNMMGILNEAKEDSEHLLSLFASVDGTMVVTWSQ